MAKKIKEGRIYFKLCWNMATLYTIGVNQGAVYSSQDYQVLDFVYCLEFYKIEQKAVWVTEYFNNLNSLKAFHSVYYGNRISQYNSFSG
jgi:hypothetical protein